MATASRACPRARAARHASSPGAAAAVAAAPKPSAMKQTRWSGTEGAAHADDARDRRALGVHDRDGRYDAAVVLPAGRAGLARKVADHGWSQLIGVVHRRTLAIGGLHHQVPLVGHPL